jgi:hypothetical protein
MEYIITNPNKPTNSVLFFESTGCNLFVRDDQFVVCGANSQEHAEELIAAHNPPAPTEPTVADKLASVGLSLEELREALGSN